MQKKILITGASGFVGSTVVEKALELGYETWAGIRVSSNREYLKDERIHFIYLNYSNKNKLVKQLSEFSEAKGKFDYVVHVAGITKARKIEDFEDVNLLFKTPNQLINTIHYTVGAAAQQFKKDNIILEKGAVIWQIQ